VKNKKLIRRSEVAAFRDGVKREGRTVVFTNGCFDLLHAGHIRLFREARKLGDVLVVGVNNDASVRRLKGPNRPVFPLRERLEVLSALTDIGGLISFGEDTPLQLIRRLRPDVLVKGGDWKPEEVVGRAEVEAAGGRLVIVPYLEGRSSSSIIDRVLESVS
jgi:rfaE bifunctional protein nucleotidyltransferase chain/domain